MKIKLILFLWGLVSLSACAQAPLAQGPVAKSPDEKGATPKKPAAKDAPAKAGPPADRQELTEQILYQYLLAEIAAQRGQLDLAAEAYLDLARRTRDARIARRATEFALHTKDRTQALQAAKLWLDLEPDSIKALQAWITLQASSGQLAEARPYLESYLKASGEHAGLAFLQIQALFARHPDKQAELDLIVGLAKGYPAVPEAHFAVAQAAWGAEKYDRAEQALDAAHKLRPGWEAAALFKGQILQRKGEAELMAYWREFLERNPEAREVRVAYAKQLARAGRFAESRQEFERLLQGAGENPEIHLAIGLLALQLNDLDAAEGYFTKALELGHPDDGQVKLYLGQLNESRRRYEQALQWYQAVGKGPRRFPAQLQSAVVMGKLGRVDEARALLKGLATANEAERIQVIQAEAQVLREAGDHRGVYEMLSGELAKQPDSPELLYDRAMAAEKVNKLEVLEKDLRRLIELKPDHAHAYNALGYTLADRTSRIGEALELLNKALALAPEDPFILDSMGWAQFKAGRLGEAVDYLKRAYAARPDPEIAAHLGEVLWNNNQKDEAGRVWEAALKDHPDNDVLRETVSRFKP